MSRESARAAEGSDGPGETRSESGGAGVSGGASGGFLTSMPFVTASFSLVMIGSFSRVLSFSRFRSRTIFAGSSLAPETLSLPKRLTLAGEFVGSVFILSATSVNTLGFAIFRSTYLVQELSGRLPRLLQIPSPCHCCQIYSELPLGDFSH